MRLFNRSKIPELQQLKDQADYIGRLERAVVVQQRTLRTRKITIENQIAKIESLHRQIDELHGEVRRYRAAYVAYQHIRDDIIDMARKLKHAVATVHSNSAEMVQHAARIEDMTEMHLSRINRVEEKIEEKMLMHKKEEPSNVIRIEAKKSSTA